jgi:zinc resistance-associated protein
MLKALVAVTAVLAIAGTSISYAGHHFGGAEDRSEDDSAQEQDHRPSIDDVRAFGEVRIAALKAGLQLTTDQEKNWPAFEQAIRDLVKLRVQRMQDREADSAQSNPFDQVQRRARAMSEFGAALKGFADAGMPLYQSLSDAQKRRFSLLSHFLPTRWIAVEAKQRTKGHGKDQDSDDD